RYTTSLLVNKIWFISPRKKLKPLQTQWNSNVHQILVLKTLPKRLLMKKTVVNFHPSLMLKLLPPSPGYILGKLLVPTILVLQPLKGSRNDTFQHPGSWLSSYLFPKPARSWSNLRTTGRAVYTGQVPDLFDSADSSEWDHIKAWSSHEGPASLHNLNTPWHRWSSLSTSLI
ncbi:hypothetical protein J6590_011013, partial [Homalodisca vitripennis]